MSLSTNFITVNIVFEDEQMLHSLGRLLGISLCFLLINEYMPLTGERNISIANEFP